MSRLFSKIIVVIVILGLILSGLTLVFAQTGQRQQQEEMSELERRLQAIEEEVRQGEKDLTITQAQREKYEHEINIIRRRISQLNTQIRQSQERVRDLTGRIRKTEGSINVTISEIEDSREKLTEILRAISREDKRSVVEILAQERDISGFFNNTTNLESLSLETKQILGEIVTLKINLEEEKNVLDKQRDKTEQLAREQALEAEENRRIQANQETLLRRVRSREEEQKEELAELRRQATEIRARIFELVGVPTDRTPDFGEAYEIAQWVSSQTGIRPAFLLAIIQQESAMGRNVGQCHLADLTSGASVHIRQGTRFSNGMHPTRDVPRFLTIVAELNKDPLETPISCPMAFGWGGAMGPAQFIPSTWMRYRDRLHSTLGRPANPWLIRDSFLASGTKLTDYGARAQTRAGERRAALIYFSGTANPRNPAVFLYADQVLARADGFQRDIDLLIRANDRN